MKRRLLLIAFVCGATLLVPARNVWTATADSSPSNSLDPLVLVGVAVILIAAKLCGELFERIGQPAVLGELVAGILLGNLVLFGFTAAEPLKSDPVISALAQIGVIILLFEVGLESNLKEMLEVGWSSLLVAVSGVVVLFFLGWGVAAYFMPDSARLVHIFVGATLTATSVGITARVLKDLGRLQTREARIILGAAVIDDVLGLLLLSVVAGAIKAAGTGAPPAMIDIAIIAGKAVAFLLGALLVGHYVTPHIFRGAGRLKARGVLLALSISFCFLLAWVASKVGLAPVVGAFAAGLVLDELHFKSFAEKDESDLQRLIVPLSTIFVPIFFVMVGLRVDLRAFAQLKLLGFAAALTVATILGKQLCSLAVIERKVRRLVIGIGVIPRGEVSLILAGIGTTLFLPNAQGVSEPVVSVGTFGAIVITVIITTLVTPPALKWAMKSRAEG
ncbi:MAG: cation:proton antiporter [Acidobacteria bacterium]|nr:MAG: cation:proton antiporter [Acidobacteriota bacterium]